MGEYAIKKIISLLIVDDDPIILNSIQRQLTKDRHYAVDMTQDPTQVIHKITSNDYDLVLCDIRMKPITGIEVVKQIRIQYPSLPVIFLTGYVDDKIIEDAKIVGSNDFLMKPIRRKDLINSINKVLKPSNNRSN